MAITVTDILTQYGQYYEKQGQNMSRLKAAPMQPSVTLNVPGIQHLSTDETIYKMANPIFTKVLQPFQKNFTDKGGVEFLPNEIRLSHMKVDQSFYPQDIEDSWLGFLAGDSSANQENWPIVRYLLEEYIMKQVIADKESDVVFKGKRQDPTTNVAGDPADVMDGFAELIRAGLLNADNPMNHVAGIGDLNTSDIFDQVEAFDDAISRQFANENIVIFCAPEMEVAYLRKKRALGYYDIKVDGDITTRIDFTRHILKGVPSMIGSKTMFATLPQNIIHLKKRDANKSNVDIQKADRLVKVLMDWWEGLGFGVNKLVWATDNLSGVTIKLDKSTLAILDNGTGSLTATTTPTGSDAPTVEWESTDEDVATVSNGTVSGVAAGTCKIIATATKNGISTKAECAVTVTAH